MESSNTDIKINRKIEKKGIINLIKATDNQNVSKEKEIKIEINQISSQNSNNEKNKQNKKDDNIPNLIKNAQINEANKYNLNYDYNKLLNNNLQERKDQLSDRKEKEKIFEMVNKEILKSANYKNENYTNNNIESLNKLQNKDYYYNQRYNIGNGLNLNLNNLNKNINEIQEIKLPNLNIELEKAIDKKNNQNKGNISPLSSSILNLNLNLNINNNIINNITTPNNVNNEQINIKQNSGFDVNNILNSKRAVSAKPHIKNSKKDYTIDKLIQSINYYNFLHFNIH